MKGIVFTNFLEMVENHFGYELVNQLIENSDLPSKGVYTSVGTYEHSEMVKLITGLHERTGIPTSNLLREFGQYLFPVLAKNYNHFIQGANNAFELIEGIDNYIHVEVHKLYPDAELPHFDVEKINDTHFVLIYHSDRRMGDFAHGLLLACLDYYQQKADIHILQLNDEGSKVRFEIIAK